MNIRAVIFDFGGVLCFHPERETIARAAEHCGVEYGAFLKAMWKDRTAYDGARTLATTGGAWLATQARASTTI